MPHNHKCGISGCKALIPRQKAICAPHREAIGPALLRRIEAMHALRVAGKMMGLAPYYTALAEATVAVREKEQASLL